MDLTLDQLTDLSAPASPQKAIWRIITLCCGYILSIQILSSVTDQSKLTFLRSIFQQQCFVYVQPCMLLRVSYSSLHIQPRSRLATYSALWRNTVYFQLILFDVCFWLWASSFTQSPTSSSLLLSLDFLFECSSSVSATWRTEEHVAISMVSQDLIMKDLVKVIYRSTERAL